MTMEPTGHSGDVPRIYVRAGCGPLYCAGVDLRAGHLATPIAVDAAANRSHVMPSPYMSAS